MIAAIYARKSTDQNVSDEEKSVARQKDGPLSATKPSKRGHPWLR